MDSAQGSDLRPGMWAVTTRPVGTVAKGRPVQLLTHQPQQGAYDCAVFDASLERPLYVMSIFGQDLAHPRPLELLALMSSNSRGQK